MLIRLFAAIILLSVISTGAWAQSNKIQIEGRTLERADAGERVRVIVNYSIPEKDLPDSAAAFAARREMISAARASVLQRAFGEKFMPYEASLKIAEFDEPTVVRPLDNMPSMAMMLTREEMEKLAAEPGVVGIYTDPIRRATLDESTVLIGAPVVWNAGNNGAGVAVAVLDTGSSHDHTMMNGKVVGSACFSTNSIVDGVESLCPDGSESQTGTFAGTNCPVDDPATSGTTEGIDGCFHGTHVASTAMGGSYTVNSLSKVLNGVATGANLVAVQVFSKFTRASDCDSDNTPPDPDSAPCVQSFGSDQNAGLDFVLTNAPGMSIKAANMSLGGGKSTAACDTGNNAAMKGLIDQLRTAGVATVIASGNESFTDGVSSPGCISTAVTVGATSKQDVLASFSNSSPLVDLLAPGVGIRAAYPKIGGKSYSVGSSGTSMATPHVAGAFALLSANNPGASVQQIEDALKATGKPILDPRNLLYKPRIRVDLANALLANGGGAGIGSVAIAPADGFFAVGQPGNSASFSSQTYTLTNSSSGSVNWTVAADKSFIVLNKSSGSLAANASDTVIVSIDGSLLAGGGTGSDDGTVTFTVGGQTSSRPVGVTANFLANDDFADALPMTGLQTSVSGTSLGASKESGEPAMLADNGDTNAGGASIWYSWTSPLSGEVQVSTAGSSYDTMLRVYTGTALNALTPIASNDDEDNPKGILTALVSFTAVKGTTYAITVDGFNGASGNVTVAISASGAAANDNFASATAISGAMGSATSHSANATAESGEPAHGGQTAGQSIWFDWTAPSNGDFVFNTDGSDFDTVMAAYTGSAVNALTQVASNDNQGAASTSATGTASSAGASQITFTATSGTVYHIAVDGKSGASGLVNLSWVASGTALPNLVTAVLPYARSVQVGKQATAFMTVINAGAAGTNCSISLVPGSFQGGFTYQTTNASNVAIGSPNTPIDIAGGNTIQNFVFAVTPSAIISQQELGIQAKCDEGTASSVTTGVNSFILSSANAVPADMLMIGLTSPAGGTIAIPGSAGASAAAIATLALGGNASLTLSADDGGKNLPLVLFVCETDPVTGLCLASPAPTVTISSVNGETRTFAVFANATGDIPFLPGTNRLFVRFKDSNGVVRGATNFAISTAAP
jgi:Subtilase family